MPGSGTGSRYRKNRRVPDSVRKEAKSVTSASGSQGARRVVPVTVPGRKKSSAPQSRPLTLTCFSLAPTLSRITMALRASCRACATFGATCSTTMALIRARSRSLSMVMRSSRSGHNTLYSSTSGWPMPTRAATLSAVSRIWPLMMTRMRRGESGASVLGTSSMKCSCTWYRPGSGTASAYCMASVLAGTRDTAYTVASTPAASRPSCTGPASNSFDSSENP